jgi:hypothetical protein
VVVSPTLVTLNTFTVTGYNAQGCSSTALVNVLVNSCNGLPENPLGREIEFFPNPAHGVLSVRLTSEQPGYSILIFDTQGKTVLAQPLEGIESNINLEYLSRGLYILQIRDQAEILRHSKLVVE